MSKRKLVHEAVSGSTDSKVKIDDTLLNTLFCDEKDELDGKLELGPTMLDITKGLKYLTLKNNDIEDMKMFKYTILLYITRGLSNAAQFLEIESKLSQKEIIDILFAHLKYKLPGGKRLNKRKKDGKFSTQKYFEDDVDFHWLNISTDHAYIYVGDSDGKRYDNNLTSVMNFIYRSNLENRPRLCSIM